MFIRLSELSSIDRRYDCCVIGSGPAGITTAMKLAESGRQILLLEGGGEEFSSTSQEVYMGRTIGDPYFNLHTNRLRFLGGSSNHWGGWCRSLEEIDFEFKDYVPQAAWPITKADLDPYLGEASSILELEPIPADSILDTELGIKRIYYVYSPPVLFGEKYKSTLEQSQNIVLCLDANVTSLQTDGSRVTGLTVENFEGDKVALSASYFVLATGGIENSRLLLWSDELANGALIRGRAPLGGYWMDHPAFTIGEALVDSSFRPELSFFNLTPEKQRELGLLNCGIRLHTVPDRQRFKLVKDLACIAPELGKWAFGTIGRGLICESQLRATWETEPLEDNRVSLSATEKDCFGMPRVDLYWRKNRRDLETLQKTAVQFANFLIANRLGRARLDPWVLGDGDWPVDDEIAGHHHMGGTRMADSSANGVVDKDCKVFGQENLYVMGSSVFPSSGHANPTLTIVQLALRLSTTLTNLS